MKRMSVYSNLVFSKQCQNHLYCNSHLNLIATTCSLYSNRPSIQLCGDYLITTFSYSA